MSIEIFSLAPTSVQVLKAVESNPKKVKLIIHGQATSDANSVATLWDSSGTPLLTTIDYAVASVYSTNPLF